jgi:5-methylcytosine-specific restriction endonuclease McrA
MASVTVAFKTLVCSHTQFDRDRMLHKLSEWFSSKQTPKEKDISSVLQELGHRNAWQSTVAFTNDPTWNKLYSHDSCESLTQLVASKLAISQHDLYPKEPKPKEPTEPKPKVVKPRKAIPKKIRGEAWSNAFGESMKGHCYCCKKELHAFDTWHAGHIISHSNGGKDDASNLRPTCSSCNLSMGIENMNDFKLRCYS